MKSGLQETLELLYLGVGDRGRLEHIKKQLEAQHELYDSDQQYLNDLTIKYQDVMKKSQKGETSKDDESEWIEDETPPHKEEFKNNFCSHCGNKIGNKNFCTNCGLEINEKIANNTTTSKKSTEKKHSSHKGRNVTIGVGVLVLGLLLPILILSGVETVSNNDRTSDASLAKIMTWYDEDNSEVTISITFTDGDNGDSVRTSGKMDLTISKNKDNSNPVYSNTHTFKPDDFRTYNQPMLGKVTSYVLDIDKGLDKGKHYLNAQVRLSDGSTWKNLSDTFSVR